MVYTCRASAKDSEKDDLSLEAANEQRILSNERSSTPSCIQQLLLQKYVEQ